MSSFAALGGSIVVTFADLRDAKPQLWSTAAQDLRKAAQQCERVVGDIYDNGVQPLKESWADHVGQLAVEVLKNNATKAQTTSVLARAGVEPVDALANAVLTAQSELENGIHLAESNGLKVDPVSGKVSLPRSLGAEADPVAMLMTMSKAQGLIDDAIEAATQADNLCSDALRAANENAANPETTVEQAQEVQSGNVKRALEEIRNTLPDGLSPSEVAAWWNGLTPKEQFDLQRAVPVELSDLEGIPESVKSQLANDGRGYNPVETVRWAIDNAHNDGLDRLDNNCTLFASEALRAGGLDEKDGQWSKRDWLNPVPDIPGLNGKDLDGQRYTTSWYNADQQRDFFLHNGGSEVSLPQARPGDVIYFNWADPELHNGEVSHHTAVVTAVLPDGEVLYTQHTPGALNYGYESRLPVRAQEEGGAGVTIVRPKETW
ncbi:MULTISPECIES: amidase domain-containing protein [Mycobacterium]|uniref:amidase domain-containing protein n=1 Tax=Mycobacterium TaxID=1763 RepID=UPI000A49FC7B|nr:MULTISPECIES: amidase domain-containing protein [Mycobacterium]MCG7607646.1 amidase domain-containing protein [Mycobacterium sp. CnD-18-1]